VDRRTQAKKVAAQAEIRTASGQRQMSHEDVAAVVTAFGDPARIAQNADKAKICAKVKLTLTYQPGERLVEASIKPA
jgi:hypothetical protein